MEIVKWGVVVTGILILRKIAWGRITRRMQYGIWIVAMILFMLQPFVPVQSRWSIENVLSGRAIFREQKEISAQAVSVPIKVSSEPGKNVMALEGKETVRDSTQTEMKTTDGTAQQTEDLWQHRNRIYVYGFRWCGTLLLGLGLLWFNLRFYRYCLKERSLYKRDTETGLQIYLLKDLPSPFLFGNRIYVDEEMVQNEQRLHYMVLHEYCHYRHGDWLWVLLRNICMVLYFYNPFVWIAVRYMKQDCELACDEAVMRILKGEHQRKEYGYTLLALAKRQNHRVLDFTVTTSMSGGAKRLKERIEMISSTKKTSGIVSFLIFLIMLCLVGCTFTEGAETTRNVSETENDGKSNQEELVNPVAQMYFELEKGESENGNLTIQNKSNSDIEDSVYNVMKWEDGFFYFSDMEGLKRFSEETSEVERLADGNVKLGNFNKEFLYYIRYPGAGESASGIVRMNITDLREEQVTSWSEEMWTCRNVFFYENKIYLELSDSCEAYEEDGNTFRKIPADQNMVYQVLEKCGYSQKDAATLPTGYTNVLFQYHKLICRDASQKRVCIYNADTGKRAKEITDVQSDVLLSNRGVVYKDLAENIYLQSWNGETAELLYEAGAHDQESINYGTYDEEFLYGFVEEETQCTLIKLSWEGGYERSKTFISVEKAVQLGFSVNHGVAGYWQNGQIIFEKV